MTTLAPEMSALKNKLKATWQSGDYGIFAEYLKPGAMEFFERLQIQSGTRVLDVACGAGQLTIPAAYKGIKIVGLDLAANLVAQARAKAQAEKLDIQFDEGDAEDLPYPDRSFDVVFSLIGSMFAPRPDRVASEMIRVCKPGGRLIMGNWTAAGFVGQMFKILGRHVPPPKIAPSPLLWGDEATCRERFGNGAGNFKFTKRLYPLCYPFAPEKVVDFFFGYYGPTNRAYVSLDENGKKNVHDELTDLWSKSNSAKDGTTSVMAEYLEVQCTAP